MSGIGDSGTLFLRSRVTEWATSVMRCNILNILAVVITIVIVYGMALECWLE